MKKELKYDNETSRLLKSLSDEGVTKIAKKLGITYPTLQYAFVNNRVSYELFGRIMFNFKLEDKQLEQLKSLVNVKSVRVGEEI